MTRGREDKILTCDLVVYELAAADLASPQARQPETVVENQAINGWAFSPDELDSLLCYTVPGVIVFKRTAATDEVTVTMESLNEKHQQQWLVCFAQPVWRPDGQAVACRGVFLGGRQMSSDQEPPIIPGEDAIFVFPTGDALAKAADPDIYRLDPSWQLLRWTTQNGLVTEP